jgi:hypothetical protein
MTEKRRAAGAELVIPLAALAFTAYFLHTTAAMEWEAKANGVIVGWVLIALIAVQVVRSAIALVRREATPGFDPLVQPADATRKRLGIMAVTVALVVLLPWMGLGLGLFAALVAGFAVMGVRPWRRIVVVSFCVAAGPVENLIFHFIG